jgi:hypothetical protein
MMIMPAATAVTPKAKASSSRDRAFIRYNHTHLPERQRPSGFDDTDLGQKRQFCVSSIATMRSAS